MTILRALSAPGAALLLLALTGTPLLLAEDAAASHPAPILLLADDPATVSAMISAGYPSCAATGGTGLCFRYLPPWDITVADIGPHPVIVVGSGNAGFWLGGLGPEMTLFVQQGGAVVALVEDGDWNGDALRYDWLGLYQFAWWSSDPFLTPFNQQGDDVRLSLGANLHPVTANVNPASLDNWGMSWSYAFTLHPNWLSPLLEVEGGALDGSPTLLTGHLGLGCAFVSGMAADRRAAANAGALELFRETVLGAVNCNGGVAVHPLAAPGQATLETFVYAPQAWMIDDGSGVPIVASSLDFPCDALSFDGTTWSTACRPAAPPPPGFVWGCRGPALGAIVWDVGSVAASVGCTNIPTASCTATATLTGYFGMCWDTTGLAAVGEFDFTLSAAPSGASSGWAAGAGGPDP